MYLYLYHIIVLGCFCLFRFRISHVVGPVCQHGEKNAVIITLNVCPYIDHKILYASQAYSTKPDMTFFFFFLSQNGDLNNLSPAFYYISTYYIIIIRFFFFFLRVGICSYTYYTVHPVSRPSVRLSIFAKTTAGSLQRTVVYIYIGNQAVKYVWSMKLIRHFYLFFCLRVRVSPGHSLANLNFYLIDNVCTYTHTHTYYTWYTHIHMHTYTYIYYNIHGHTSNVPRQK